MPEMPAVPGQRVVRAQERAGFSVGHPEVPRFVWIRCRPLSTVRGQAPSGSFLANSFAMKSQLKGHL